MEAIQEEEAKKNYPSLPSNYVSIAQLQERWLQQQKQKQPKQEEEKQEEQQTEEKLQEGRTMENKRPGKKRQDFYRNRQRSNNGGERKIDGQRVYVARRVLDGSSFQKIGAEEVSNGVEGVYGMEKKTKGKGKKYWNSKKKMARVEGCLIGEDQLQKLSENWGISGCSSGKNGGQGGCSGELEGNGERNGGVEENVSLCMEEVVPENTGKEVNSVSMGGKCGGDEVFDEGVWRNSDDWGLKEGGASVCMIEVLPENDELEEEVPVTGNGDDQTRAITQEVGNVCMVEMLQENKVEEDVSVGVGRTNGKGGFRGGQQEKDSNSGKWKVPEDSKAQSELGKNEEVEEGVCIGEKEHNGYQKGWIRRGIQAHQRKERTSGNLGRNVRRDLQVLSLGDSREGNVTSRKGLQGGHWGRYGNSREGYVTSWKGLHGGRWGRYGKSRDGDGGLVWVKKGEISDTNAAEI